MVERTVVPISDVDEELARDAERFLGAREVVLIPVEGAVDVLVRGTHLDEPIYLEAAGSNMHEALQVVEFVLMHRLAPYRQGAEASDWAKAGPPPSVPLGRLFGSPAEVQRFLNPILSSDWFRDRFPHAADRVIVHGGIQPAWWQPSARKMWHQMDADPKPVEGPDGYWTALRFRYPTSEIIVCHELAHAAASVGASAHGAVFARCYLEVVRKVMGRRAAVQLRRAIEGAGDRIASDQELRDAFGQHDEQWRSRGVYSALLAHGWNSKLGITWGEALDWLWRLASRFDPGLEVGSIAADLEPGVGSAGTIDFESLTGSPHPPARDRQLVAIAWLVATGQWGRASKVTEALGLKPLTDSEMRDPIIARAVQAAESRITETPEDDTLSAD